MDTEAVPLLVSFFYFYFCLSKSICELWLWWYLSAKLVCSNFKGVLDLWTSWNFDYFGLFKFAVLCIEGIYELSAFKTGTKLWWNYISLLPIGSWVCFVYLYVLALTQLYALNFFKSMIQFEGNCAASTCINYSS